MMRELAHAKINLSLQITGRRADGYHLLDSLVAFAEAGDVLWAEPADQLDLQITGPQAAGLHAEPDNLVLRASRALATAVGRPATARLRLEKNLPVASGIGGGSADAAAALRLLCRLWQSPIDEPTLHRLAAGLGADVPVCLRQRTTRMQGIGDQLTDMPSLPDCGIVLVNPGLAVATQAVFRQRLADEASGPLATPPAWTDFPTLLGWLAAQTNDLQPAALRVCPPIAPVLAALQQQPGCGLARMSGSGATCFGLFATAAEAAAAAAAAALQREPWWVWGGGVL